ncbi:basic salivary proline-rich protein 1-like [Canis lupus familiaris]|uniref:basic salivary proline-rich protein 1-like n=1 Tax=Canis lupus familiaris TaxID=9615 RepID=UPI0018F29919|nr:basic salivary proline-rich protein 1-like [Canis lupus familiaris]
MRPCSVRTAARPGPEGPAPPAAWSRPCRRTLLRSPDGPAGGTADGRGEGPERPGQNRPHHWPPPCPPAGHWACVCTRVRVRVLPGPRDLRFAENRATHPEGAGTQWPAAGGARGGARGGRGEEQGARVGVAGPRSGSALRGGPPRSPPPSPLRGLACDGLGPRSPRGGPTALPRLRPRGPRYTAPGRLRVRLPGRRGRDLQGARERSPTEPPTAPRGPDALGASPRPPPEGRGPQASGKAASGRAQTPGAAGRQPRDPGAWGRLGRGSRALAPPRRPGESPYVPQRRRGGPAPPVAGPRPPGPPLPLRSANHEARFRTGPPPRPPEKARPLGA